MGLFWFAILVAVAIAYSGIVQDLPVQAPITLPYGMELALSAQFWAGILPLAWLIIAFVIWKKVKPEEPASRSEYLLAYTMATMTIGFAMLIFFTCAVKLPIFFLKTLG